MHQSAVRAFAIITVAVVSALPSTQTSTAAESASGRFVDRVYRDAEGEHKYVVFEPVGYTPQQRWPVMFYLHGASGRGRDGRSQIVVGLGPAVKAHAATLPILVVFPQNENLRSRLLGGWTDESTELDRALKILTEVERDYAVDPRRRILAGVSMGGFGAWSLGAREPQRWAAVIPVSGGGHPDFVQPLSRVPVWAFHAADDTLVPPSASTDLVQAINAAGGRAFVSILPKGGHNIGAAVFAQDAVFEWLKNPATTPQTDLDWSQPVRVPSLHTELPFVVGADVDRAIRVHLGTDLLESLAVLAPRRIPAESLAGYKPAMQQSAQAGPLNFDVTLSGIAYQGQLSRAQITPQANNVLRVQLGLSNLRMSIQQTQMQSRILSATASPMLVTIGHVAPVWLTADIRPRIENRRLKLELVGVDFRIPPGNWSIAKPSDVRVRPLPFLEGQIADRLASGLAERQHQIEQEVTASVPRMLAQLEQRVAEFTDRVLTYAQWPMPLWQPRFKIYPQHVTVDERGISLELGALVAALAPRTPTVEVRAYPSDGESWPESPSLGLNAAVSTRLVTAWSQLLAASDVGRFHVLDLNAESFRELGTAAFWNQVLTESNRIAPETELNTEFILREPIGMSGSADDPNRVGIAIPHLQLLLSARSRGETAWRDHITCDIGFTQFFQLQLVKSGFQTRALKFGLQAAAEPEVTARFVEGNEPIPSEQIARQFAEGWKNTFSGTGGRQSTLKDMKFDELPLRWSNLRVTDRHFVVEFSRPGIRVRNVSAEPLTYFVRGRETPWGEPQTLAAGEFHEFRPTSSLIWWSGHGQESAAFTLPLGTQVDVRGREAFLVPDAEEPVQAAAISP